MTRTAHIRVTPIAVLILALATAAPAAEGDRLPYQLRVVNSHNWGEHTEPWIGDTNGDGLDEVLGYNEETLEVCPIRFVDGTYLEQGQLNLAGMVGEWQNAEHHGPADIDDDGVDEYLISAVVNDTLWLHAFELGRRHVRRILIQPDENYSPEQWRDTRLRVLRRISRGSDGTGWAVAIGADFGRHPRGIALYSASMDSCLWWFPGGTQFNRVVGADIDDDGDDEIVFGSSAPNNGAEANGTTDEMSYVGVLDDDGRLLWLRATGWVSSSAHVAVVDLDGDDALEIVSGNTPNFGDDPPRSTIAVWDAATGDTLSSGISVPERLGEFFVAANRRGEPRVLFENRGADLYAIGWKDEGPAIVAYANAVRQCDAMACVRLDGVPGLTGDCLLVGTQGGRLAVYDADLKLLAEHLPVRMPIFPVSPFVGPYTERADETRLLGISDRLYLFNLVKSPLPWSLILLIAGVAFGSAGVTALSVSPPIRERTASCLLRILAPLMPWAAAERARARRELMTELEIGGHDKMLVTRPLRHLVDVMTMARGAESGPEGMAGIARRWTERYRETAEPSLGRILDLTRGWGGAPRELSSLRETVKSTEDGLANLIAALDRDSTPELSSLALRVGALEHALQELRTVAGEAFVTDIAPALRDTLDLRQDEIRAAAVELRVDVDAIKDARAWVAPDDFQFLVSNLISNAIRAMDKAVEKRLTITGTLSGGFVELRFADTGCGIPEAERERIFERGATTKKNGGGTGLWRSREALLGLGGDVAACDDGEAGGTAITVRMRLRDTQVRT